MADGRLGRDLLWPRHVPALAAGLGLAATAVLGIGSLTGMVSAMGLIMQPHAPAEAFRLLGFKRSPLVTVLAVIVVLVTVLSGKGTIHEMDRGSATGQVDSRKTMAEAFQAWSTDPGLRDHGGWTQGPPHALWRPRAVVFGLPTGPSAGWRRWGSTPALVGRCSSPPARAAAQSVSPWPASAEPQRIQESLGPLRPSSRWQAQAPCRRLRTAPSFATRLRRHWGPAAAAPFHTLAWQWADRARLIETGWKAAYQRPGPAWGDRSFLNDQDLSRRPAI